LLRIHRYTAVVYQQNNYHLLATHFFYFLHKRERERMITLFIQIEHIMREHGERGLEVEMLMPLHPLHGGVCLLRPCNIYTDTYIKINHSSFGIPSNPNPTPTLTLAIKLSN